MNTVLTIAVIVSLILHMPTVNGFLEEERGHYFVSFRRDGVYFGKCWTGCSWSSLLFRWPWRRRNAR